MLLHGVHGVVRYQAHRHSPRPGDLVIFPGWLRHRVEPTLNTDLRISFTFNMFGLWQNAVP